MFDAEDAIDALCEAVGAGGPPTWTVFDREDGRAEGFALRHDPDAMLGWRAPADVWAIGLVSAGTATVVGEDGPDRRRCQVACVVDRWGVAAGRVRIVAGLPPAPGAGPPAARGSGSTEPPLEEVLYEAPQDGRVLDILRRCVGAVTSPPSDPMPVVLTLVWLAAVAREAGWRREALAWPEAIALHPAVSMLGPAAASAAAGSGQDPGGRPGDPVVSMVDATLRSWEWEEIRRRCQQEESALEGIDPALAAWMDEGMFSRWVADAVVDVESIVAAGFECVAESGHPALRRLLLSSIGRDRLDRSSPSHCDRRKPARRR